MKLQWYELSLFESILHDAQTGKKIKTNSESYVTNSVKVNHVPGAELKCFSFAIAN